MYNEKLIQILNSDLALKNKVYFNVSKIIFNKIAGNGPVISNLQSEKVLLEDELEILDNQLTGVVLPAKKDLISDNELDLILAETLKLPKTFNSTISFFGQKGFKKMRALNQSYLYSDYSDKMNIGLGENLDGLLFVGTKRPLKFLAKVIAIKNNQLLLKILTIETRFKLVWESLCNKFGIVE